MTEQGLKPRPSPVPGGDNLRGSFPILGGSGLPGVEQEAGVRGPRDLLWTGDRRPQWQARVWPRSKALVPGEAPPPGDREGSGLFCCNLTISLLHTSLSKPLARGPACWAGTVGRVLATPLPVSVQLSAGCRWPHFTGRKVSAGELHLTEEQRGRAKSKENPVPWLPAGHQTPGDLRTEMRLPNNGQAGLAGSWLAHGLGTGPGSIQLVSGAQNTTQLLPRWIGTFF